MIDHVVTCKNTNGTVYDSERKFNETYSKGAVISLYVEWWSDSWEDIISSNC